MKSIKALFGVFVVATMFYLAWKVLPPYFSNYQFEDELENQARYFSYNMKSEQEMRETIAKKAHDYDIPLTPEQIKVQHLGNDLSISVDYTVHIDIPVYPFDLHFTPATKNKRI